MVTYIQNLFLSNLGRSNTKMLNLITIILASHHHFTEFIKVHGSGAVFIKFLKDSLKLFLGERSEKFTDESSKSVCGDVAKTLLVIYPEKINNFYDDVYFVNIIRSLDEQNYTSLLCEIFEC